MMQKTLERLRNKWRAGPQHVDSRLMLPRLPWSSYQRLRQLPNTPRAESAAARRTACDANRHAVTALRSCAQSPRGRELFGRRILFQTHSPTSSLCLCVSVCANSSIAPLMTGFVPSCCRYSINRQNVSFCFGSGWCHTESRRHRDIGPK
jgi:hypothetical protein